MSITNAASLGVGDALLRYVYSRFRLTAQWPLGRSVELALETLLDDAGGIETVCDALGKAMVSCQSLDTPLGRIVIRLRGLDALQEASDDVAHFLGATRYIADKYRDANGADITVDLAEYARSESLDELTLKRVVDLVDREGRYFHSSAGTAFQPSRYARLFSSVASVPDYLARVSAFEERQQQRLLGMDARAERATRYVFLSHATSDQKLAEYLANVLRTSVGGLEVFVASSPGEIPTGVEWLAAIKRQLKSADTYLILLTPTSVERLWLWFETGAAWMGDRRLLPVTAMGLPKADVPLPLGAHQVLSLEDDGDAAQLFRDLRIAVADASVFAAEVRRFARNAVDVTTAAEM